VAAAHLYRSAGFVQVGCRRDYYGRGQNAVVMAPGSGVLRGPFPFSKVEKVRSFSGTARAGQESRLSFKVPGTVELLGVKVGDRVRAGQVLTNSEMRELVLQLEQADQSRSCPYSIPPDQSVASF